MNVAAISLAPLLDAAPAIPPHALAAMAPSCWALVQFAAPRGRCRTGRSAQSGSP